MPNLFIPLTSESSLLSKDIIHNQTQGGTDGNPHAGAAAAERVDQKISASDTTPPGLDKNDMWIDTANLALKYNTGATGNTEQFTGSLTDGSETVSTALTDPVGMNLAVDGAQTNTTQSAAYTDQARTDRQSLSIGGNTDPENVSFTVTGRENTAGQSYSTTLADTGTETFTPAGNQDATGTLTFTGTESTIGTGSFSQTGVTDGQSVSYSVGGNTAPRDATVTLIGKSDTTQETITGTNNAGETEQISIKGNLEPTNTQLDINYPSHIVYDTYVAPAGEVVAGGTSRTVTLDVSEADTISSVDTKFYKYDPNENPRFIRVYVDGVFMGSDNLEEQAVERVYSANNVDVSSSNTVDVEIRNDGNDDIYLNDPVFDNSYWNGYVKVRDSSGSVSVETNDGISTSFSSSGSKSLPLTKDSSSLTFTGERVGSISWSLSYTANTTTVDPSVSVGSSTVSHSGVLNPGQTVTESVSIPDAGSGNATVSVTGPVDVDGSWTEVRATENPSVDVDGTSVSHTGVLAAGETASPTTNVTLAQSGATLSASTNGEDVGVDVDYTAVTHPEDIQITDVTSGQVAVSNSGVLSPGASMSDTYTGLPSGSVTIEVDGANLTPPPVVDWEIVYDEVTASDVTVVLDGEETPVGILKSGETQTVSTTPRNLSGSLTFEINDTAGQTNSYTLDLEEASFVKLS
jgi:hypothetical protein